MQKIQFSTTINASKQKVWETLWTAASYREWTSPFGAGSYETSENWKVGSKVLFLGDGGGGMVARVAANRPGEYMSFEHLGEVKDGIEDTTSEKVKQWAGAKENYTLVETGSTTTLTMDMDITEDFKAFFEKTWPLALEKVKALAENQ